MRPTVLVYSSHNRCHYIHKEFIVQRALESWDNKTLMHLPMSQSTEGGQHFDYNNFRWYYEQFRKYGLNYYPFFWSDNLSRHDVDLFFHALWHSQVVVLGGGSSTLGLARYKYMGEMYYNDPGLFGRILHERQDRGLMTVGFSAGADQLCQYLSSIVDYDLDDPYGFGLCRNIVTTLHHEYGRENKIHRLAYSLPHCLAFGLPNDSGLGVDQGYLPSGNIWQIIWFITDNSWDVPRDQWHIKTRWGMNIYHAYCDGRHWGFNGGDMLVRIMAPDNSWQRATIITNQGVFIDYWTWERVGYRSIQDILANG